MNLVSYIIIEKMKGAQTVRNITSDFCNIKLKIILRCLKEKILRNNETIMISGETTFFSLTILTPNNFFSGLRCKVTQVLLDCATNFLGS